MGRGIMSRKIRVQNRAAERGRGSAATCGELLAKGGLTKRDIQGLQMYSHTTGFYPIVRHLSHDGKCHRIQYLNRDGDGAIQILSIYTAFYNGYAGNSAKKDHILIEKNCEEWNILSHKLIVTLNVEQAMKERK